MADQPDLPTTTVTCPACGFENSAGLYCQDCGARLPEAPKPPVAPSAPFVPPVAGDAPPSIRPPAPKNRKPWKYGPLRNAPGTARVLLGITLRTLAYAALAALLVQILRPPTGLPAAAAPFSEAVVENALRRLHETRTRGGQLDLGWAQLNSYLAARLDDPRGGGIKWFVLDRASVAETGDGFTFYILRRLAGLPICTSVTHDIVVRSNGIGLHATGAALGRIPLPLWLAGLAGPWGTRIEIDLDTELDALSHAANVTVAPGGVRVQFANP